MVIVIIAGGSGTRLWPLSQGNHPKHLLSLTGERSMLQNTYRRAKQVTGDIYVVPEISHAKQVREQLPDLAEDHVLAEPSRRGTASCFVLALARIKATHEETEPVVFMHADHHITDDESFATAVRAAADASSKDQAIALVGVKPSYPATGFGYIECADKVGEEHGLPVFKVKGFKEKPKIGMAKRYVAGGNYLWNQGLFAAPLAIWESQFKLYAPYFYATYEKLVEAQNDLPKLTSIYMSIESETIDYALVEKTPDLIVVPANYDWVDIGSFLDLHAVLKGADGNALQGNVSMINCEDSMIHATEKPVIAIGLSGIIVVDTPEGLLVCAKEQSQLVGDLSKKLAKAQTEKSTP